MKTMQDFYNWLATKESILPEKIRLQARSNLNRTRLAKVSSESPWFIWDAPQTVTG